MSDHAIKFKEANKNLDFTKLSFNELNSKLPKHTGIINFKITKTSFLILNIMNDDSSAVKFFWQDTHDLPSLDIWYNICKDEGTFIDIGAHTGLYTLTAKKANNLNKVIVYEPFYLNMARLITNLRLNNLLKDVDTNIMAVSNKDGYLKFKIKSLELDKSYLSKGGKVSLDGEKIKSIKLDSIIKTNLSKPIKGIKIDTEGEDLNVLLGAENIIRKFRPKIIIEVREENKEKIKNFFNNYNYKLYDVYDVNNEVDITNYNIETVSNIYAVPN